MSLEQLAQGGTAVGTGLNTKKGYAFLFFFCKSGSQLYGLVGWDNLSCNPVHSHSYLTGFPFFWLQVTFMPSALYDLQTFIVLVQHVFSFYGNKIMYMVC